MFKQEDYGYSPNGQFSPGMEDQYRAEEGQVETYILQENCQLPNSFELALSDIMPMMNEGIDSQLLLPSPPQQLEETLDVATKFEMDFFPVSPRGPPERTIFPGDLDFQVEINATDVHKKKYLFSNRLNRIYVDMRTSFPVWFRWRVPTVTPLFARATVVFSDQSQAEKRVERCTQHTHDQANGTIAPEIVKNVLHSSRSLHTSGVHYCGRPEQADSWFSTLVELGQAGNMSHAYQFVCKNSCSSGINRRAIDVIFTLEDASGHVYGRQTVGARVCACPRRDMMRDEEAEAKPGPGKRKVSRDPPNRDPTNRDLPATPRTKKPRVEEEGPVDDTVVSLPPLQVVGVRPVIAGLEVMAHMMEQSAALAPDREKYSRAAANIRRAIAGLRGDRGHNQA